MGDYDQTEWEFQQQLIARMQQQQKEDEDEAERAWQAALAAQGGGGGFGSSLLNPKAKQAPAFNIPAPVDQSGMTPEEIEEEAERAWREALALQGMDGDDQPVVDEDAERAWREALEAQQEEIDLRDDEYYEELYRNTRINEGNKVDLENDIQDLNEQRWKLRDKKAEYYSGMKDLMESSKALEILRGQNGSNRPLRGILKKRLERVKIEKRLTLRMARSPYREGPRKRVGFILPDEMSDGSTEALIRRKNEEVERLLSTNKGNNDEEFLEMSLQFIQDFKEEEERLKQESEEIKRMEEQVARLEAELAREGIALAQKYNSEEVPTEDPLADAKNASLPARIKRGTKGFGGVFIDEVHKMLGQEELEKIEARIASIPQEDAEDAAEDDSDDEKEDLSVSQAADPGLSNRIKRGTKGFGGVFMEQVHRMLEEEKEKEAAAAKTSPPVAQKTAPGTPPPNRPKPTPPAKPAPTAVGAGGAKPAPTGMRLQLEKVNKEEEDRKAAEAAAKREDEEKKNQERLKQAAEARKILVSPRPATLPSPRGTVPQPPTKPNNNTPSTAPTTNNNTTTPSRPLPTAKPAPTQQPPQQPQPGGKTWSPPSPTPRFVPNRPERSSSDPTASKPAPTLQPPSPQQPQQPSSPLSTAQRLEAQQKGGSGIGNSTSPSHSPTAGRPAPIHPGPPGATPPVPRAGPKPGPMTGGGSAIPSKPAPGAAALGRGSGSFIVRPSPSMITVKPLNHPEPVKRGVGRPNTVDPLISAKANFFEQKQQQNTGEPVVSEEVIQRRARLDMFKNKILAKQAPPLVQNS